MPTDSARRPTDGTGKGTELRLEAAVGERDVFRFRTRDGVESPASFRPAELLLLETLADNPPASVLVPDANYGVVGTVMGALADDVWMTETSARAAALCRANAARNGVDDRASVAITGDLRALPATVEAVAMAPAAYAPCEVVEQRLADAAGRLSPTGELYLAAGEAGGLTRYGRTLGELAAGVERVAERDGITVLRATGLSGEHRTYAEPRVLRPSVGGVELTLVTYPGLFSHAALDDGTRQLARALEVAAGDRVLDLGCGYGPLGVYAARTADCDVWLTDDDCVAAACARASARRSGAEVRAVYAADGTAAVADRTFDRVVTNPPTHAGAGVLHDLMRGARDVLDGDGTLQAVHHEGVPFDQYVEPYFDRVSSSGRGDYRIVTARP